MAYCDLLDCIEGAVRNYERAIEICDQFLVDDKKIKDMFVRVRNDGINIGKLISKEKPNG